MKIPLTKQECRWLADLANKAKIEAEQAYQKSSHPILALRYGNMADLEATLNAAIQKQIQRERMDSR
jgi:hypothetical protein